MRVAATDAYGQVLNVYRPGADRAVDGVEPDRPWAVYLAGTDRRFRLLCFDLDAKTAGTAPAAARDADVIAGLLGDVGLAAVVCQSGPAGGRHVWVALADSVPAETVATLARLARHLCPTLDIAPLTNAITGCVRPPGAPHRDGGHSTVLGGELRTLMAPTGTAAQVRSLVERLAGLVNDTEPAQELHQRTPLPLDEHARLYLPGPKRAMPAVSVAALSQDAASGDASAVLWRVLIGAAAARWRHADIAALAPTAAGLEHVRTYRDRSTRHPRSNVDAARVLRRQWDKAVRFVATNPRQAGDDPTFDARAEAIATHVRAVQSAADTAAGRWSRGGGPADRRVLDVLSVLVLQALNACVEADTRRLALLAGIGRETARTALLRLAADGWIAQSRAADGPRGAHWTIGPSTAIHNSPEHGRSQADPRPVGAGAAERSTLLATLTARSTAATHDLFTPSPGLGHQAGNIYARTTTEPQTVTDLAHVTGSTPEHTARVLDRLTTAGVLTRTAYGWHRRGVDRRSTAALGLGVAGRLDERARRYRLERELWAWWQAEDAWRRAPRHTTTKRRAGLGQITLLPELDTHAYGPHPHRIDGRLDWREARHIIENQPRRQTHRYRPTPVGAHRQQAV